MALGTASFLLVYHCPCLAGLNDPPLIQGDDPVVGAPPEVVTFIFILCDQFICSFVLKQNFPSLFTVLFRQIYGNDKSR
jgi:hypothetical protein